MTTAQFDHCLLVVNVSEKGDLIMMEGCEPHLKPQIELLMQRHHDRLVALASNAMLTLHWNEGDSEVTVTVMPDISDPQAAAADPHGTRPFDRFTLPLQRDGRQQRPRS